MQGRWAGSLDSIGVVGAGIVGLAVARRFHQLLPHAKLTIFDKEAAVGQHQTGHNSGVVHQGLYYAPGSLKAILCRRGVALLKDFCADHDVPYVECGKLVVAVDDSEVPALREIRRRAEENGVKGLEWLGPAGLRDVEPHATGVAAVHSPKTAITDYASICRALASDLVAGGSTLMLGTEVTGIRQGAGDVRARTAHQEELTFDALVLCPGLQSDTVARLAGNEATPAIVPFRGEYLRLVPERTHLVRGLIYPVPDPAYPFLGVHVTRRVDGGVDLGPNAVLAMAKEGYRRRDINVSELRDVLLWPGFQRLARQHWRMGVAEISGSLSRRVFLNRARRYVPELTLRDVVPAPSGVRAQAVDRSGGLVDDFVIQQSGSVTAVRNAPSPAATSALAIAERICDQVLEGIRS
jgi:L-2-hydroxyglutarate oxidase LhgO